MAALPPALPHHCRHSLRRTHPPPALQVGSLAAQSVQAAVSIASLGLVGDPGMGVACTDAAACRVDLPTPLVMPQGTQCRLSLANAEPAFASAVVDALYNEPNPS